MKPYITVIILEQKEKPTKKRKNPTKTNKRKTKNKQTPSFFILEDDGTGRNE
jgi:hypothetical protein